MIKLLGNSTIRKSLWPTAICHLVAVLSSVLWEARAAPAPAVPVPGSSMFSVSVWRLKGSVEEFSRCLRMMDLSMMVPEGSLTGSVIRVSIRGSEGTRVSSLGWGNSYRFYLPINPQCRTNAQGPQYTASYRKCLNGHKSLLSPFWPGTKHSLLSPYFQEGVTVFKYM